MEWLQMNKYFHVVVKRVERDGWKFVLLARFSDLPSYIINYSLSAIDARYYEIIIHTICSLETKLLRDRIFHALAVLYRISLFFTLLALWFCISVPLTLIGGLLGTRAASIDYPVRTNQIPREIPERKFPPWLLVLGAGTLPFGTLFIELFFILSSIWLGRFYYVFGFLFIVLFLLVIVCGEVSLVLTYMHLCVEDWKWWWKAFFASGSVAFYVFLYSINYLVFDLRSLSGPVSATLYLGYSLIMALAIMLSTGAIGFLLSFYFVHYLFSSVKID
ncbi:Transmembrane 9 superfamily member 12 [Zea mays]|uniref:Transmembrane 9 superfamily member n=1 Tax=Zea mays TaxID=4577 RepID=A0A1D6LCZ6_MAIZE|nr:Transmembrane 9 superfamily member 12 [Zea mays]